MSVIWERYKDIYTGTMPDTNDYYAVSRRSGRWWECWIAGQYLGKYRTMREAKGAAELHRSEIDRVQDVEEARAMALLEHLSRGHSLISTLRVITVSTPANEPVNLPFEPENLPYEPNLICEWFLMCTNQATGTAEDHKGESIPICDRCRKLAGK